MPRAGATCDTRTVLTVELALRLRAAGLAWEPRSGDRFVVPNRNMDDEVFVISEMTIGVHDFPSGPVIGFNGTTEWALDSLSQQDVVWLPREDQLRELIGEAFVRLSAVPGGFAAVATTHGREEQHVDNDAERAYARCLLARLT